MEHQGRGLPLEGSFWSPGHCLQPSRCAAIGSTLADTHSITILILMVTSTSIPLTTSHGDSVGVCYKNTSLPALSVLDRLRDDQEVLIDKLKLELSPFCGELHRGSFSKLASHKLE